GRHGGQAGTLGHCRPDWQGQPCENRAHAHVVKEAVDRWIIAAKVSQGRIFRAVSRHGTPWGKSISENVIWYVVRRCAERMQPDHLAPHDLRRTCAKLCHTAGGE